MKALLALLQRISLIPCFAILMVVVAWLLFVCWWLDPILWIITGKRWLTYYLMVVVIGDGIFIYMARVMDTKYYRRKQGRKVRVERDENGEVKLSNFQSRLNENAKKTLGDIDCKI